MFDVRPLIRDYKHNVPLEMLEAKYKLSIHTIIKILYAYSTKGKVMFGVLDEVHTAHINGKENNNG